ncbi:MAG: hypothetical protein ACNI27_07105 [Desulfovibrio sp.]
MSNQEAVLTFHFDGEITKNHTLPAHVLASTLQNMDRALTRCYLGLEQTSGIKNRRISAKQRPEITFWVGQPEEGGFILRLKNNSRKAVTVMDHLTALLKAAVGDSELYTGSDDKTIKEQVENAQRVYNLYHSPHEYQDFVDDVEANNQGGYVKRAALKEFSEALKQITRQSAGTSTIEFTLQGSQNYTVEFTKDKARKFIKVLGQRTVGEPIVYSGAIQSLSKESSSASFKNHTTKGTSRLLFLTEEDFLKVHKLFAEKEADFIGAPVYEYGTIDVKSCDIYFVDFIG